MQLFAAIFIKNGAKCLCDLKNMLQNYFGALLLSLICITKSYVMNYQHLNVIYDATVGLQLHALWSEVSACFANCWQKIAISPQVMFANIWHYM